MKAIIHIGMMRTGTSSIRTWLTSNRAAMAEVGVYTLHGIVNPAPALPRAIFQVAVDELGVHEKAAWIGRERIFRGRDDQEMNETVKLLTEELEKLSGKPGIFLYCCDPVYNCSKILMVALDNYFSRFFDDITYVVYIRSTVDFLVSLYSHVIRSNLTYEEGTLEFSEYLKKCANELAPYGIGSSFGHLFGWDSVFGDRLNVRLLESDFLVKGDLIEDFANLAGIDTFNKPPKMHESFAAEYIEYMRSLNLEFRENLPWHIRHNALQILEAASSGKPKLAVSDTQAKSILDIHREQEERIRLRFFPDRQFLFSPKSYGCGIAPVPLTVRRKAEIESEIRKKMTIAIWKPHDLVAARFPLPHHHYHTQVALKGIRTSESGFSVR